ncbi:MULTISPECIES: CPBP family intramembrane glutamic endopeptidase [Bacillus]|uniref:CPBP family intramembrane metalloprotease n=1 Tax=Bacillus wiedmannii TaxID=1890302 RepID=A0A2C4QB69_9BACI|nr:type II CAAX endopeptidase family protein [Bacillus wiedmannii]KPU56395.1 CAAX protease self-immunity family protein [Bacillus wiedmannii]PHD61693.1 CPBP family intramembrane metalloprotease [Bacillus wiedmannii]PRT04608.1 CPBP family intramembrane metalloprotease [Bacillus wiedmannii]PRT31715.1 CPBP family intramembrane metalloprotease [Bacillus wiedmannii]PRT40052.1 CPBP family intramembrane metalloprotease [Bacillus wiedmannii]
MIILTMLFIYLTLGEGVLGKRLYNKLKEDIQTNKNARVSFYIRTMSLLWALTIIMLITSYSINIPFEEYGLKLPSANHMVSKYFKNMNISLWIGVCIGFIVPLIMLKKSEIFQKYTEKQMSDVSEMLPNNYRETILWIFICITAGVTEELLFRSFMMNYLSQLFPALSIIGVLVISSIIFGLAHFYQGWKGIVGTMILGFMLGRVYVTTGSIYPSIIIHMLIDLLVLIRLFILKGKVILQRV